jgi:hypothetical protein
VTAKTARKIAEYFLLLAVCSSRPSSSWSRDSRHNKYPKTHQIANTTAIRAKKNGVFRNAPFILIASLAGAMP